jgi:hypothetical protein
MPRASSTRPAHLDTEAAQPTIAQEYTPTTKAT